MKRSPRRPLILKRRKLPFLKHESETPRDEPDGLQRSEPPAPSSGVHVPDGVRIVDHPSLPNTQVVVIPKAADLQSVIDALSAKGKECGPQGPNKFILLSGGSGSVEDWPASLGLPALEEDSGTSNKQVDCSSLDDSLTNIQWLGGLCTDGLRSDPFRKASNKENRESCPQRIQHPQNSGVAQRPPYSYMAMIQFAINSKASRRMTLKEIYTWIENHFPYFKNVAKPGWKNSIRHNLSLHDMFIRETSQDGKISYWTIRPEANRCLTLDQVYKQQKPAVPEMKKVTVASSLVELLKEEPFSVPLTCEAPMAPPPHPRRRELSGSRRKQCLAPPSREEPVLLFPDSTFFDSGLTSDLSTSQDTRDAEPDSPGRVYAFKTPIKCSRPASSTPSKPVTGQPPPTLPEPWVASPQGEEGRDVLEFSPIRTPCGVALTPQHHGHTPFSLSDTPLFSSPRELLTSHSTHCEGLVLDTMNDSLSKILVDISFSGLEDEELDMCNISWSQLITELK
ncbi:forkhead box protein M1-like [Megalops cyprinoides]|uniref:forkhead box protein M1-like n=1 Tax=Megalops cyprinoides TaxID=118141 RepID=UPI001864A338|nr:forkhead box protein M1-like [Megalops cyprinoides]